VIRVFLADDHSMVRKGLAQILAGEKDISVTGEAADGEEAIAKIRQGDYDVAILDLSMPGRSGLELLSTLRSERPDLPVLMLSMHPEKHFALRVLKSGAAGYLSKSSPPEELLAAVRRVAAGKRYLSASLAEELALSLDGNAPVPPHKRLSDREFQVMMLIAAGKPASAIAAELFLSVKTVSTYRARVLAKLDLDNTAQLIQYVYKHGLNL
jgi:two-component system invasion response regulator UvrY